MNKKRRVKNLAVLLLMLLCVLPAPQTVHAGELHKGFAGMGFHSKVIFIGDFRTSEMTDIYDPGYMKFFYRKGRGFRWMSRRGVRQALRYVRSLEDTPTPKAVVFNMGINDMHNRDRYIRYMNKIAPAFRKENCCLYFMSLNPVESDKLKVYGRKDRTNKQVEAFNQGMKVGLKGYYYLNTYSRLQKKGYRTRDGLHYDKATSARVLTGAMEGIARNRGTVSWEKKGDCWYGRNPRTWRTYKNCWVRDRGSFYHVDAEGRLERNCKIKFDRRDIYVDGNGRWQPQTK